MASEISEVVAGLANGVDLESTPELTLGLKSPAPIYQCQFLSRSFEQFRQPFTCFGVVVGVQNEFLPNIDGL